MSWRELNAGLGGKSYAPPTPEPGDPEYNHIANLPPIARPIHRMIRREKRRKPRKRLKDPVKTRQKFNKWYLEMLVSRAAEPVTMGYNPY